MENVAARQISRAPGKLPQREGFHKEEIRVGLVANGLAQQNSAGAH